jgi:hypothetical protein
MIRKEYKYSEIIRCHFFNDEFRLNKFKTVLTVDYADLIDLLDF